jgi:hypothetical protein
MTYKAIWKPKSHVQWKADLEQIMKKIQEKLDGGHLFGIIGPMNGTTLPLDKIAIRYISAKLVTEGISLEYEVMGTPQGNIIKELLSNDSDMVHNINIIGVLDSDGEVLNVDEVVCFNLNLPNSLEVDIISDMPK